MAAQDNTRLHLLGIRHHGPGSAALLRRALDALEPECVLIEGPSEGDALIPYVADPGMKPPVAMLLHASGNANLATFIPFAEFSPEWQAMRWALERGRAVRFIDWPAAVSLGLLQAAESTPTGPDAAPEEALSMECNGQQNSRFPSGMTTKRATAEALQDAEPPLVDAPVAAPLVDAPVAAPPVDAPVAAPSVDALDLLAEAAGYADGETFWNALIEQGGPGGEQALAVFASIETAMTEARAAEARAAETAPGADARALGRNTGRDLRREAFMRGHIRTALKEFAGHVAVVCGAWHVSALRSPGKAAEDRALIRNLMVDLPRVKVEATWVPWTDSRLSTRSGYGAGVISPGWYRHLWSLYERETMPSAEEFAALWQSRTALLLRQEGYSASTASAIEATRLALGLAALRELPMPGLAEMREAALATLCHANPVPLAMIEQKLYIGERVGELGEGVPQMPLARDLLLWQRRTRLKPQDLEQEIKLDLRSEAGLLKSTLLHRLGLIGVHWGKLVDAQSGRGTFREQWVLQWVPELSVALAEALVYGVTIEQAAANRTLEQARATAAITTLAELVHKALIADLPDTAAACIALLQAAAVSASDLTDLMLAVSPLARVLRYGSARKLPENALRALIRSLSVEINAGMRIGSRSLDDDGARARIAAMEGYDEALRLFGDAALAEQWHAELGHTVDDEQVTASVAGLALRRLHDAQVWELDAVSAAFARRTGGHAPPEAGAFLEGFLRGGTEILLQDEALLQLLDGWLVSLEEAAFTESLPLLRRSLSGFDSTARRRLFETLKRGPRAHTAAALPASENPAFAAALPLLRRLLGMEAAA